MAHPLPLFRFNVALLHILGIVHPSCSRINRYISQAWSFIVYISTVIFVLQEIVTVYLADDLSDRASLIRDVDIMGMLVVVQYQLYWNSAGLFRLMSDLSITEDEETAAAVAATSQLATKLSKLLAADIFVLAVLIMVAPLGSAQSAFDDVNGTWKISHGLPMSVWYPVEISSSNIYALVYVLQALPLMSELIFYTLLFVTFATLALHVSTRFRVLTKKMRKCKGREMITCIQKHQSILRLVRDFNRTMKSYMGYYVICIVIAMGTTSMEIIAVELGSSRQLTKVFYFLTQTGSVMLCCGFGELVTKAGDKFFEAIIFSPWTETDMKYRKLVIYLSMQASRPVRLRAGLLYNLSLPLYSEMMKTWYRLFNILTEIM